MSMSSTQKLIAAFVLLILGIVFITQIATLGQDVTTKIEIKNESIDMAIDAAWDVSTDSVNESYVFTVTNAPTGWKSYECPLTGTNTSSPVIRNSSGYVMAENTDYVITEANGNITFLGTILVNSTYAIDNETTIDYTYCGDDYMTLSWGRTGIDLVPGFFALALLLISVGLFYSVAKETGLIG